MFSSRQHASGPTTVVFSHLGSTKRSVARLALRSQMARWSLFEDLSGTRLRTSESEEPARAQRARKVRVTELVQSLRRRRARLQLSSVAFRPSAANCCRNGATIRFHIGKCNKNQQDCMIYNIVPPRQYTTIDSNDSDKKSTMRPNMRAEVRRDVEIQNCTPAMDKKGANMTFVACGGTLGQVRPTRGHHRTHSHPAPTTLDDVVRKS